MRRFHRFLFFDRGSVFYVFIDETENDDTDDETKQEKQKYRIDVRLEGKNLCKTYIHRLYPAPDACERRTQLFDSRSEFIFGKIADEDRILGFEGGKQFCEYRRKLAGI